VNRKAQTAEAKTEAARVKAIEVAQDAGLENAGSGAALG
jgi:hypothetical protein